MAEQDFEAALLDLIDAEGAILTGWTLVASYIRPAMDPDDTGYFYGYSNQPAYASLGLLHMGLERMNRNLRGDDDD